MPVSHRGKSRALPRSQSCRSCGHAGKTACRRGRNGVLCVRRSPPCLRACRACRDSGHGWRTASHHGKSRDLSHPRSGHSCGHAGKTACRHGRNGVHRVRRNPFFLRGCRVCHRGKSRARTALPPGKTVCRSCGALFRRPLSGAGLHCCPEHAFRQKGSAARRIIPFRLTCFLLKGYAFQTDYLLSALYAESLPCLLYPLSMCRLFLSKMAG